MPIDNGGPAAYVPEPFHGDKREREMEKIAWKRQRSSDSGGNWRRFRSVSTFDICQIVRQGVRGIAGGALRLIREPPPPLDHGAVAHSHRHSHKLHNSAFPLPFVWKRLTSKSTHARPTHSGARSSGKGSEYSCTGSVLQAGLCLLHHLASGQGAAKWALRDARPQTRCKRYFTSRDNVPLLGTRAGC